MLQAKLMADGDIGYEDERVAIEGAGREILREGVRRVVEELPDRQREAVILVYLGGMNMMEAGREIGIGRSAVGVRLAIARGMLRSALETIFRRCG